MPRFEVRDLTHADIDPAVEMYRSGGWGERREFLEWALANPAIRMKAGDEDGVLVATAMATIDGSVGWIGSIFVDAAARTRGFGRAMTEAACDLIDAAGCRTQALIASPHGKPLYDSMGFRVDALYQILEAPPDRTAAAPPPGKTLRPMRLDDLDGVCSLDRRASGEDRRLLLTTLVDRGWVVESASGARAGELSGFLVSIMDDFATVVAPDLDDATCLLEQMRFLGRGRARTVHAAVPVDQAAAWRRLEERGWSPTFQAPRMLRGDPVVWSPDLIWGILGFAFG